MNGFQIKGSSAKDRVAFSLVASFFRANGSLYPFASRFCASVVKASGANPSYAMCGIPVKDTIGPGKWDKEPGVALKTNFAGNVRLLSRASCGYFENGQSVTLMNGWVVVHGHALKEDSIVTQIFDDRHIMASYYTCFGKMFYNPSESKHYFVSNPNDPLIFNKNGHGDCVDSPFGPRFAPGHRFGHTSDNITDPSSDPEIGSATSSTRKWTVKDILRYLRDFFYEIARRPSLQQDFGLLELPKKFLDWPSEFGNNIVENKAPHNFTLETTNLLEAICKTLSYAGPYELRMNPISNTKSRMSVMDFSKRANTGVRIFAPDYFGHDLDMIANNPEVAEDAHIKQSAMGYVHNVVNCGDAPCIEFMASTDPADADCFASTLEEGWTAAEKTVFAARLAQSPVGPDAPNKGDITFFNFAARESPSVFSYYKLSNKKNPFGLSKYASRTESGNWRILPHQLTSYNTNAQSPLGLVPREIVVELKLTDNEYDHLTADDKANYGYWRTAGRYSELQLSPCGRFIQLPGLRDFGPQQTNVFQSSTWKAEHISGGGNDAQPYANAYLVSRHVRIQVVAQSDHCLVAKRGHNSDVNKTAEHIDPGAPPFSLLIRNEPMQYVDWLRRNQSYPIGIGGMSASLKAALALQFQPAQAQGSELWTDSLGDGDITNPKNRLDIHTQKFVDNHKRIMWEGHYTIGRLTPVYDIGQLLTYDGPNVLSGVTGVVKCIVFDSVMQKTKVEIGPPAFSTIWDGPMQMYLGTGGSGVATQPAPYSDKYDLPYNKPGKPVTAESTQAAKTSSGYESPGEQKSTQTAAAAASQEPAKSLSRAENRQKNMQADYESKMAAGDQKGAEQVQNQMRREGKAEAARVSKADAKAQQITNKGSIGGKSSISDSLLGKNTSGSVTFASGKTAKAGELQDAMFGKGTAGSVGTMKAGEMGQAGGLFNTKAVDAFTEAKWRNTRAAENARSAESSKRFSQTGWGGKAPMQFGKPTPQAAAPAPAAAPKAAQPRTPIPRDEPDE